MKISNNTPHSWRDLQDRVAALFSEAGYHTQTPKTIETARGKVEVDVYVEADHEILKTFVCECKNWNSRVPKEKVHAFRQVVQDSGAMLGLLISNKGFQKGAIDAAKFSNVLLLTWDGLMDLITKQWLFKRRLKLEHDSYQLRRYTNVLHMPIEQMSPSEKKAFYLLCDKYEPLCLDMMDIICARGPHYLIDVCSISFAGSEVGSMEEFFNLAFSIVEQGTSELKSIIPQGTVDWNDNHSLPSLIYTFDLAYEE